MPKVNLESNTPAIEYRPPNMVLAKGAPEGFAVEAQGHKQAAGQWGAMAEMGAKAFNAGIALMQRDEEKSALEANNEYMIRVNALKQDISDNKRGSNGEDSLAYYAAEEKKIREEVFKNSKIRYRAGEQAFRTMADRVNVQNLAQMDRWQSLQKEEAESAALTLSTQNLTGQAITTGDLATNLLSITKIVKDFATSPEAEATQIRAHYSYFTENVANAYLKDGRYDDVDGLLNFMQGKLPEQFLTGLRAKVKEAREYDEDDALASEALKANPAMTEDELRAWLAGKGSALPGYNGNIELNNRPRVKNPDGSISTVRSMSFNEDGQEIVIPTVSDGGRVLSEDEAIELYHKSGKYFGKFATVKEANAFAQKLHRQQEALLRGTGEGQTWTRKEGANLEDLQPSARAGTERAAQIYAEMTGGEALYITSGNDSNVHAGKKGVRGSHYNGDKIDVATDRLANDPEFRARYISRLQSEGIYVGDEYAKPSANSTAGHLDINFMDYRGGGAPGGGMGLKRMNNITKLYRAKGDRVREDERQAALALLDSFNQPLYEKYVNGALTVEDVAAAYKALQPNDYKKGQALAKARDGWLSMLAGSVSKLSDDAKAFVFALIDDGRSLPDREALEKYIADNNIGPADAEDLRKRLVSEYGKDGVAGMHIGDFVKAALNAEAKIKDNPQEYARYYASTVEAVKDEILLFRKKNQGNPNAVQRAKMVKAALTDTTLVIKRGGVFGFGQESITYKPAGLYAAGGAKVSEGPDEGTVRVTFANGRYRDMNAEEFNSYLATGVPPDPDERRRKAEARRQMEEELLAYEEAQKMGRPD